MRGHYNQAALVFIIAGGRPLQPGQNAINKFPFHVEVYWSYIEAILKLYWSYIEAMLKLYWSYIEAILKLYWSYIEVMFEAM